MRHGGWDNNCHLKELISSTVYEAWRVGQQLPLEGVKFYCRWGIVIHFWASLERNFFSFSLSFFSKITSEQYVAVTVRAFGMKLVIIIQHESHPSHPTKENKKKKKKKKKKTNKKKNKTKKTKTTKKH